MAFGSGSNSFDPNTKLYTFRIKTKDLPAPIFEVQRKTAEGYETLPDTVTRVGGSIIGLKHKVFNHKGKDIKSVNVTMQDGNDVYFVTVGYTFIGRNILNSILNLKSFNDIEISLYQSKPKPDSTFKTGFASVAVRQGPGRDKELIYGLYKKEQLPVIKKVKVNGEMVSDTEDIDAFFEKEIVEFEKVVRAAAAAAPRSIPQAPESSSEDGPSEEELAAAATSSEPTGKAPF